MSFEDYLSSNLGSYKDELSKEQLMQIKGLYDKLLIWQNTAQIAFKKGLDNKQNIDYTNDYEKAMEQVSTASQKLSSMMDDLKSSFGIENFEDSSRRSM